MRKTEGTLDPASGEAGQHSTAKPSVRHERCDGNRDCFFTSQLIGTGSTSFNDELGSAEIRVFFCDDLLVQVF
ncbi:hypothetical protein [Algoriphagus sp. NG3]|uniref:hypothetical protein n=1 Tax=Algoriphagus sp. NG3 TaxID=3097546 RepID=UPI002A829E38|nr:hypothetical protein [Algoriphagus sp. NG3]WPR76213.1 hypothetical protein SLW71_02495 [Algoriphagus sp. NG3]